MITWKCVGMFFQRNSNLETRFSFGFVPATVSLCLATLNLTGGGSDLRVIVNPLFKVFLLPFSQLGKFNNDKRYSVALYLTGMYKFELCACPGYRTQLVRKVLWIP
jgi:hypothetical protein